MDIVGIQVDTVNNLVAFQNLSHLEPQFQQILKIQVHHLLMGEGKQKVFQLHPFCFVISLFHEAHLVIGLFRINGVTPIEGCPQDIVQQPLYRFQIRIGISYDK